MLTRLFDKRLKRDMISPDGGNRLRLYVDMPRIFAGWEVEITDGDIAPQEARAERDPEAEIGKLRSLIRFHLIVGGSRIEQTVILERDSSRLDFETRVDWRERHRRLCTEFSLTTRSRDAHCGIQHGFLRRPVHTNTSWEQAHFEFSAHQYADLSDDAGGLALLDNGRYGHRVLPGTLALSLLRSENSPDSEADNGEHEFVYSIYSHPDDFRHSATIEEAAALNSPFLAVADAAALPELPFELESSDVFVEAFKRAERSTDRILRLREIRGRHTTARLRMRSGALYCCDALEYRTGDTVPTDAAGRATLEFHPFEVMTLRIRAQAK